MLFVFRFYFRTFESNVWVFSRIKPSFFLNSLSKAGTLVFTLLKGMVTFTDEFAGLALSTLITPWMSEKLALGVEKPK